MKVSTTYSCRTRNDTAGVHYQTSELNLLLAFVLTKKGHPKAYLTGSHIPVIPYVFQP